MIDVALLSIGAVVAVLGSIGIVAGLAVWATNQVLEATRFGGVILRWYADQLKAKKREDDADHATGAILRRSVGFSSTAGQHDE